MPENKALLPIENGETETQLSFKLPTLDTLLPSANRLLKFAFPVQRNLNVYERFIRQHWLSEGGSRKTLENLSYFQLETLYHQLWKESLKPKGKFSTINEALSWLLVAEELLEFDAHRVMEEDIRLLGLSEKGQLHSFYFQKPYDQASLLTLLAHFQQRTSLLEQVEPEDFPWAYYACRRLSNPLPWGEFFEQCSAESLTVYPRLQRVRQIFLELEESGILESWNTDAFYRNRESMQRFMMERLPTIARSAEVGRPVRLLVIVEGETERLLLPVFAQCMGWNIDELGIFVLPAGGKNQVLGLYKDFSQRLRAPVFVVLDLDAAETAQELSPLLRACDRVYQLNEGEFEDTYDLQTVLDTINRNYQPHPAVTKKMFKDERFAEKSQGRVQALKAIWYSYNLGSFDKTTFAARLAENIPPDRLPPPAIQKLLQAIMDTRNACTSW